MCARVCRVEKRSTSGQQDRIQGVRGASQCLAPLAAAMTENSDKVPIALVGPDDVEFCSPPVSIARGPQSGYRVGPQAGPGLRVGVRIPYRGSGICATKCERWEQIGAPKCMWGDAHACSCAESTGFPDGCEGADGKEVKMGGSCGWWGVQIRGAMAIHGAGCLSDIHSRVPGTRGRERGERGHLRELRERCSPSPLPTPWEHCGENRGGPAAQT